MLTVHLFADLPGGARELPAPVPARAGRRVPGHQPCAVRPDPRALRRRRSRTARRVGRAAERVRAGRADGGRRRRPVDLRLPRRQHPQHPRLRAGLPQRDVDPARAELPLDPDDPQRRQLRDRPQPGPQAEEPLVRRRRRRADRRLRRRRRARRGPLRLRRDRHAHRRRAREPARRRGLLPHQRPVASVRGGVHPRSAMPYQVVGGVRFYERREVRDALAYLRMLVNPDDEVSLRRILNVPKRGIGDRAVELRRRRSPSASGSPSGRRCAAPTRRRAGHPVADGDPGLRRPGRGAPVDGRRGGAGRRRARVGARAGRATSTSSRPPTTRRTRPAWRTSPSSSPSPASSPTTRSPARRPTPPTSTPAPSTPGLADFLERVALVADTDQIPDAHERRRRGHPDDAAHRQGPGVPGRLPDRARGRRLPALARARRPARARGGAPPRLRRRHPGPRAALPLPRAGPLGLGRPAAQPRPRGSSTRSPTTWSTGAAPRPTRSTGTAPTLTRRTTGLGAAPPTAGRRNFTAAAARADAAAKAKPAREVPSLEPGDRVVHDSFGMGTVVALDGVGDKSVASIDFGSEGVKRLLLRYAPVEKL